MADEDDLLEATTDELARRELAIDGLDDVDKIVELLDFASREDDDAVPLLLPIVLDEPVEVRDEEDDLAALVLLRVHRLHCKQDQQCEDIQRDGSK